MNTTLLIGSLLLIGLIVLVARWGASTTCWSDLPITSTRPGRISTSS